jgi:hypothetical protein
MAIFNIILVMKKMSFWLTNISNRNVSLYDLNLTVRAFSSVNLMDNRHYNYTEEQLEKSAKSGSIFKKRNLLKVRSVAPTIIKMDVSMSNEALIPSRERSVLSIKEEHYEELSVSDEEFANQNSDLIDDKI